jgi:hypothetical protein
MRNLHSEKDVAEMLGLESAVLFFFVSWSDYAIRGKELVKEAEAQFANRPSRPVSWCTGDLSSTESPIASVVHQWLTEQERPQAFKLFPNVALGNGSVVWMNRGQIVSFADSAVQLGLEGILRQTAVLFG